MSFASRTPTRERGWSRTRTTRRSRRRLTGPPSPIREGAPSQCPARGASTPLWFDAARRPAELPTSTTTVCAFANAATNESPSAVAALSPPHGASPRRLTGCSPSQSATSADYRFNLVRPLRDRLENLRGDLALATRLLRDDLQEPRGVLGIPSVIAGDAVGREASGTRLGPRRSVLRAASRGPRLLERSHKLELGVLLAPDGRFEPLAG